MNLYAIMYVGLGGAIGSIARYITVKSIDERISSSFPFGTITVNITGSLILGFLYGLSMRKPEIGQNWRLFIGTGICGGFTTFSAFALENFNLLPQKGLLALIYIIASLVLGILAVAGGYWIGKSI
jgi:CrcB protein